MNTATQNISQEQVLAIQRWTDVLWSLRISRPASFQFEPGHYARLGLAGAGGEDVVHKPYSLVSAPADDFLEFLIVLIPGGGFSERLRGLALGAPIWLDARAFGFFLPGQLADGEHLWMLATGTGLGPYVSMLRAGVVQPRFAHIVLVHSCRLASDLAYAEELQQLAAASAGQIQYQPIVTREVGATPLCGHIPDLLVGGSLQAQCDLSFEASRSRVMVCGNPVFSAAMRRLMVARQFEACRRSTPGSMLFENYW